MNPVSNITIATMKDPEGAGWLAQIHIEYKGSRQKDVLPLNGGQLRPLLARCCNAIDKRVKDINGDLFMNK